MRAIWASCNWGVMERTRAPRACQNEVACWRVSVEVLEVGVRMTGA